MKILKLRIENFKCIKDIEINFDGQNTVILGDNATGKTTIHDAFLWLLFGKNSENRADFNLKTLDKNGEPIHGLEHSVEAIFVINEKQISLKRIFREVWEKPRGASRKQFVGHTTNYYFDHVPVSESSYKSKISEICSEERFRLLSDPRFFNVHLNWQKRRQIIMELCGDISHSDVIAANPKLNDLATHLNQHSVDDVRKSVLVARKKINEELETIPIKISQTHKMTENLLNFDEKKIDSELLELRGQLNELLEQKARIEAGGEIAEKQKQKAELETELQEIKAKILGDSVGKQQSLQTKINDTNLEISFTMKEISWQENSIETIKHKISDFENSKKTLADEWKIENAKRFEPAESKCPTCQQSLPAEKLELAEKQFKENQSKKLADIVASGNYYVHLIKEKEQEMKKLNECLKNNREKLTNLNSALEILKEEFQQMSVPEYKDHDLYQDQIEKIKKSEAEIELLKISVLDASKKILSNINDVQNKIAEAEAQLAQKSQIEKAKLEIELLEKQERELADELAKIDRTLFLCDEFIKTKIALLTNSINGEFSLAKFKLFNVLLNGNIEECCETTYHGVPFSDLNGAMKLNIGIDIINTFSRHYNFAPPIFIDNAESVTQILPTNGQQIKLVVSEADKSLRIEKKSTKETVTINKETVTIK